MAPPVRPSRRRSPRRGPRSKARVNPSAAPHPAVENLAALAGLSRSGAGDMRGPILRARGKARLKDDEDPALGFGPGHRLDEAFGRDRRLQKRAHADKELAGGRAGRRPVLDGDASIPVDDLNREGDPLGLNIALLDLERHGLRLGQGTVATGAPKREKGQRSR